MFKRGVILISILILIFSFYSYNVNGAFSGQCSGCVTDNNCGDNEVCRPDYANCLGEESNWQDLNGEYECGGGSVEGNSEFGYTAYSGDCHIKKNANSCYQIQGYYRNLPGNCGNDYSCDGSVLNVKYNVPDYSNQLGWRCIELGETSFDCNSLEMCDSLEGGCSCNAQLKGCRYPTDFIEIKGSSEIQCGDSESLYDGFGRSLLGYSNILGEEGYEYDVGDSLEFFNDGRLWWFVDDAWGKSLYQWNCNQQQSVVLDLGYIYEINALRVYGPNARDDGHAEDGTGNDIILKYSENNENYNQIYSGALGNDQYWSDRGGFIGLNDYIPEEYFLINLDLGHLPTCSLVQTLVEVLYVKGLSTLF